MKLELLCLFISFMESNFIEDNTTPWLILQDDPVKQNTMASADPIQALLEQIVHNLIDEWHF